MKGSNSWVEVFVPTCAAVEEAVTRALEEVVPGAMEEAIFRTTGVAVPGTAREAVVRTVRETVFIPTGVAVPETAGETVPETMEVAILGIMREAEAGAVWVAVAGAGLVGRVIVYFIY